MAGQIGTIASPSQVWLSVKEAATWLGITVHQFRDEARQFPHLLPAHPFGRSHKWFWLDLAIYAHLRQAQRTGPAAPAGKK